MIHSVFTASMLIMAIEASNPGDTISIEQSINTTSRIDLREKERIDLVCKKGTVIYSDTPGIDDAIRIYKSTNVRSWGCHVKGPVKGFGLLVQNSRNIDVNVTIDHTQGAGIGVFQSHNVRFHYGAIIRNGFESQEKSQSSKPQRQAIWVDQSSDITVRNLLVYGRKNGPYGDGAMSFNNSKNVFVDNARSYNAGSGSIYMNDVRSFVIANSKFSGSDEFGIDIVNNSRNGYIVNNTVINPSAGYGVQADYDSGNMPKNISWIGNTFTGNRSFSNTSPGINFTSGATWTESFNTYDTPELFYEYKRPVDD